MSTDERAAAPTTTTTYDRRSSTQPRTGGFPASAPAPAQGKCPYDGGDQGTEAFVQRGLNLYLKLKSPAQMPALIQTVGSEMEAVHNALQSLHYVHFARFLPTPDGSALWVITEFDGDLKSYIMDFVAVLGDVFNAILSFTEGAPPLPVQKYPQKFWQYVQDNNLDQAQPWSAYPSKTVIEINGSRAVVGPKPVPVPQVEPPALDLSDIQGNVLRGYRRMDRGLYVALRVGSADGTVTAADRAGARAFLASLTSGEHGALQVTNAAPHETDREYCLNLSFTHAGLAAVGVDSGTLGNFPEAFRQGPADPARAAQILGDTGVSAPANWELGGPSNPAAHILLSLNGTPEIEPWIVKARELAAKHGLTEVWSKTAVLLPGGTVHFGYRDGISQPRVEGMPRRKAPDMQPAAKAGEFLLGKNYVNQYGGNFIGDLPSALCDNATYAAFGILEQHCDAFEEALDQAATRYGMHKEMIAAKMMGRWRDGTPLSVSPNTMDPDMSETQINNFDYAPTAYHPTVFDDFEGMRCPVGAHARRMNPRGATVTGKPHSRRVIRRGLPYGPVYDPANPNDGQSRGLVGSFICGDLEMQYEFLQSIWGNKDIATTGLNDTRDPLIGAQPDGGGKFVIRTADSRDPITLHLPRFVTTKGRLYAFMPGLNGIRYLASLTT